MKARTLSGLWLLCCGLGCLLGGATAQAGELRLGSPAPAFTLPNLNGADISSTAYQGRPMILVVGTSKLAAEDCRTWMLTLSEQLKGSSVAVFQVIVLNKAWYIPAFAVVNELKGFVPEHGHHLVLLEWQTKFGELYGIPFDHEPRVIVVGRDGRIHRWYKGDMTDAELKNVLTTVAQLSRGD